MIGIDYDEFVGIIDSMKIGEAFDFFEEYDEECDDTEGGYTVLKMEILNANTVIINYGGGGKPFIAEVGSGIGESDYSIALEPDLREYFNSCKTHGHDDSNHVFVRGDGSAVYRIKDDPFAINY